MLDAHRLVLVVVADLPLVTIAIPVQALAAWRYPDMWGHPYGCMSAVLNSNRFPHLGDRGG